MIFWERTKKITIVISFSLILSVSVYCQSVQNDVCQVKNEGDILERKICPYIEPNKIDISFFIKNDLSGLFSAVNVPLGISLVFEDVNADEAEQKISPKSHKIKDLLDQIIEVDPRYKWKEENGVINVFSDNDYSILETRISEFKVENEFPWEMDKILVQTKEFQDYLRERNLIDKIPDSDNKFGFVFIGLIGKSNPRHKISINMKNATVREILNEIVRKRGYGTWKYGEYNWVLDGKFYQMYRLEL